MQPFKINVPQPVLDDLQLRLKNTRWPDEIKDADWDYGTNREFLKELTTYWQATYDWRAQEAKLNEFAQFKAEVAGLNLHFLHIEGKGPNPVPLLLVHGWPDSFFRMVKLIPLLTDPAAHGGRAEDAFTVIVPDLPGYGFSDKPQEAGYGPRRMADVLAELMTKTLGYQQYVAHGGDWGSSIVEQLALHHADALLGIHLTDVPSSHAKVADKLPDLSATEKAFVVKNKAWQEKEAGYQKIQGTKPETLAYGLNDSPVGVAGLDYREISRLERQRRRQYAHLHEGRFAHQRHDLLGDANHRLVGAAVLRGHAQPHLIGPHARRGAHGLR
ncbi:MAG: epoxide hydrolase, partial [Hymenobacter sp.]